MIDKIINICSISFWAISLVLLFIAILEKIIGLFGWTLAWVPYESARLLELAAILVIFVIAFILRQIRVELKKQTA